VNSSQKQIKKQKSREALNCNDFAKSKKQSLAAPFGELSKMICEEGKWYIFSDFVLLIALLFFFDRYFRPY